MSRQSKASSRWKVGPSLVVFNLLLFVPTFIFRARPANWTPFFPVRHPRGLYEWNWGSAAEYFKALFFRRDNLDVFRVSGDFVVLLLVLVASAWLRRGQRAIRATAVTAYVLLFLFVLYHHAVGYFFARPAALFEDLSLLKNLFHFAGDMVTPARVLLALGVALVVFLFAAALHATFRALQQRKPSSRAFASLAALLAACLLSAAWFGIDRQDPAAQWLVGRVVENVRQSNAREAQTRALVGQAPDLRYQPYGRIALATKPDVYVLMIEAYGEIAATCDMSVAYRALMKRIEQRFATSGFSMRSGYSRAPVHGGLSWLSIATVQTGTEIDQTSTHALLEPFARRAPTLTTFFHAMGYQTVSLQPGNRDRLGLPRVDIFGRDHYFQARELEYPGPKYGWGYIPDQYSLEFFRERLLPRVASPRFVLYMGVSTHYGWEAVPPYVSDWRALASPLPTVSTAGWNSLPGRDEISLPIHGHYLDSLEYEWRSLSDFISRVDAGATVPPIFLIVGDHQPRLDCEGHARTFNAPLHVLSRDPGFVERFSVVGLESGMFATPGKNPPLQHRGLFSLLVHTLTAQYGAPGAAAFAGYLADGVRLSGIIGRPANATEPFVPSP